MNRLQRHSWLALSVLVAGALSCGTHDDPTADSRSAALTPRAALVIPPNTIIPPATDGAKYKYGASDQLTDDLAPVPDLQVTHDGALSVRVPLWTPPGRAGMQPALSLNYNSRAALSPIGVSAGFGWMVGGLSMIHRCLRTAADNGPAGVPAQVAFTNTDQLCLNDEPLVPEVAGTPLNQVGAAFRTLHDGHRRFVITAADTLGPVSIISYGSDGRITMWGGMSTSFGGDISGNRYVFATDPTIPGPKGIITSAVNARYGLLLASVADHNGNEMDYVWTKYTCNEGTDALPGSGVVVIPSKITYAKNTNTALAATKQVQFSYDGTKPCGQYPGQSSMYVSGFRISRPMRLKDISVVATNADGTTTYLRDYKLYYNDAAVAPAQYARSQLADLLDCDGENTRTCRPGLHFTYGENSAIDGEWTDLQPGVNDISVIDQAASNWPPRIYTPDVNRDGRDDLLYIKTGTANTFVTRISNGTSTSPSLSAPFASGPTGSVASRLFPADMYGLGFVNTLLQTVDTPVPAAAMFRSNPSTWNFDPLAVGGSPPPLANVTAGEVADLDGDGLPDLINTTTTPTDPSQFLAWAYRLNRYPVDLSTSGNLPLGPNDHRLLDVDGDGSVEILTALHAAYNDPTRYTAVHAGTTPVNGNTPPTTLDVGRPYAFADLNGDGLSDAVQFGSTGAGGDGRLFIHINSGNGFFTPIIWSPQVSPSGVPLSAECYAFRTIDFNNDGNQDLLLRPKASCFPQTDRRPLWVVWYDGNQFNLTQLPSLVYSATDPTQQRPNQEEMFEVLDVNGDGLDDIAMVNDYASNNVGGTLHLFVRTPSGRRNRGLLKVDRTGVSRNGIDIPGEAFFIDYKPLSDPTVYSDNFDDCLTTKYPTACVESRLWVVSEITRHDDALSTATPVNDTKYTYQNARRDLRGRGFLGFAVVTANQVEKGVVTRTTYDTRAKENTASFYPDVGMPVQIYTTTNYPASDGTTARWDRYQSFTLNTTHTVGNSYFVYPSIVSDTVIESYSDGTSATLYQHSTRQTFDANGNPWTSSTTREDGSSESANHTYTYLQNSQWPQIRVDAQSETSATTAAGSLSRSRTLSYDAKWNLTGVVVLPSSTNDRGEQTLNITYAPTPEGLIKSETYSETAARGGKSRSLSYTYDDFEHAFPSVVTDSLGHTTRYAYLPSYGLLAVAEDQNGLQSTIQYDMFGRTMRVTRPNGLSTSYSYESLTGDTYAPIANDTIVRVLALENTGAAAVVEYNWRNKPTSRRVWERPDKKAVYESFAYDSQDRLQTHYPPAFAPKASTPLVVQYDSLDRVTDVKRPDGSEQSYQYKGLETTNNDVTDNISSTLLRDGQGRVVQTTQWYYSRIFYILNAYYAYGPFGTPFTRTDGQGNVSTRETNRLGQLWHVRDADMGERRYSYNAFGNLETEQTPQFTSSFDYDEVGRLKTETTGARIKKLYYDTAANGIGKLASILSPDNVSTSYGYDAQSRVTSETWTIGSEKFTLASQYDPQGRLDTITYPAAAGQSAFTVKYRYDPTSGSLQSIGDVAGTLAYWTYKNSDASGRFTTELFGNNVTAARSENALRPTTLGRIAVTYGLGTSGSKALRDVSYDVDGRLNLTKRTDNLAGSSELFGYDALSRLASWTWSQGSTVAQQVQYVYDGIGNLTSRAVTKGNGSNLTFTFDTTKAGPHQPISSALGSYGYDGNGRQKAAPGRTMGYTEFDLPSIVTSSSFGESYQFAYDGENSRVLKQRSNGDVTISLGDLYERKTPSGGTATHLYTVLGPRDPVAIVSIAGGTKKTFYLHAGHNGSIELVTDSTGAIVDKLNYEPYGARIQPTPPLVAGTAPKSNVDLGYTTDRHDDEAALGLINMRGRLYDPGQARFLSTDPLPPPLGVQWLSPYAYVGHNPLTLRDPSGFEEGDAVEKVPGGVHITYGGDTIESDVKPPEPPPPPPPPPAPPSATPADFGGGAPPSAPNYDGRGAAGSTSGYKGPTKDDPGTFWNQAFEKASATQQTHKRVLPMLIAGPPVAAGTVLSGIGVGAVGGQVATSIGIRLAVWMPWLVPVSMKVSQVLSDQPVDSEVAENLPRLLPPALGVIKRFSIDTVFKTANNITHFFAPKHNLSLLGSEMEVLDKALKAVLQADRAGLIPNGVFELNTLIDMYMVTIRGNILDGVLRLTTMFVAHSH